jgi:DNA-binding response OmpR family regulator
MPVLNGLQLFERLRKLPGYRKTPVIFIAGQDDPDNQATCAPLSAADLITRPILPQELAARVVMHLVRTRMRKPKTKAPTSRPSKRGSQGKAARKTETPTPSLQAN